MCYLNGLLIEKNMDFDVLFSKLCKYILIIERVKKKYVNSVK